jgi:cytochrome c6
MRNEALRAGKALLIGLSASALLSACTVPGETARASSSTASAAGAAHPGGIVHTGAQTNDFAYQYETPRAGAVAATGASAWVPAAPAPAFTAGALPPADPPAPPLAAVANRQPATPAAAAPQVDASQIVRPEAAAPAAGISAETRKQGLALFAGFSCMACHALADAGSAGSIGPSLDNPTLTRAYVIDILNTGRGAMPSFAGQMSDAEIATLADYIVGSRR